MVKVITVVDNFNTTVWGKVLMAFLHNHEVQSLEILCECSHQW